ncbi:MAG: amino acid ABC transporter substrate-binding protein [Deltaproteobacteria bacterium]|nr:amino acid ABC transporter substrate-binding protein [Deltaproteobacteria bacterium]
MKIIKNLTRFEALLSAVHTLVLALLGASAIAGRLRFRWKRLISFAALFVLSVLITILTVQIILTYGIKREYQGYRIFVEMDLLYEPTQAKVYKSLPPPPTLSTSSESRLDSILEKGVLRVGYKKDALPFVFTNDAGRLVGFDIEMAHMMARDMNFRLEFILVESDEISERLNQGTIDIMMGGLMANPGLAHKMYFSESYIDQTIAFIVKDYKREEFSYLSDVKNMEGLTVGVPKVQYFVDKVRSALPEAKIVLLDSSREFFTKKGPPLDALILSAEAGSAWSLIYPQYSVVVPQPLGVKLPTAFAMPRGDITLVKYVNTWIQDAKKSKRMQAIYNYWILGKKAVKKQPRWSVIRNVLHWVE